MATDPQSLGSEVQRDTANVLRETASTLEEVEVTLHEIAARGASKRSEQLEERANLVSGKARAAQREAERLDPD